MKQNGSLSSSMANFIINSNSQKTKLQNTLFSPNYCQGLVSLDRSLMIAQTGLELSAAGQSALVAANKDFLVLGERVTHPIIKSLNN